ncbi:unnamed protein product, partial [Adineta steineri]
TSDDREENSVAYEQFYKLFEPLIDTAALNNPPSTTDNGSLIQMHTLLPFIIKPSLSAIYPLEKENDEKNT